MPDGRAYADVIGGFRRGFARGRAGQGDYEGAARSVAGMPEAESYAAFADRERSRQRQEEMDSARRTYAQAFAGNDFEAAESVAAKVGNVEGVAAARSGRTQLDTQQRTELLRGAQRNLAELDQIEAAQGQGYESYLGRARSALQQNPNMDPTMRGFIEGLPDQWNPNVTAGARVFVTRLRDGLLSPEQLADNELTARQRETQERQADISERRAAAAERTAEAAMIRAERGGSGGANADFSRANSLRDEYNQQTAGYRTIADFAARSENYMQRVAANPRAASGQADVGLVYALAKIYDPTSVVREGEFTMVARQGGYGEQMRSWVTQALGGGLSTGIRNQLMAEIRNGVRAAQSQRDQINQRYEALARRRGIDPADVIDDYAVTTAPGGDAPPAGGGGRLPPIDQRRNGEVYEMPDGGLARWDAARRVFIPEDEAPRPRAGPRM